MEAVTWTLEVNSQVTVVSTVIARILQVMAFASDLFFDSIITMHPIGD